MEGRLKSEASQTQATVEAATQLHPVFGKFISNLFSDDIYAPLEAIQKHQYLVLNTVLDLHLQGLGIAVEAKKMELEVLEAKALELERKESPYGLQYVRERARKVNALCSAESKNIKAAHTAGKLTLPKVPAFEDVYTEEKTKANFYKSELQRLLPKRQADELCQRIDNTLAEHKREVFGLLASNRSRVVKAKNRMLDVADENSNIAIRLGETAVKLGKAEAQKLQTQAPKKIEVTDAEAQQEFAVIASKIAQGEVKLGEAEQKEFNLASIVMPTFDLEKMALPTAAPLSNVQINAALSIQPGAVPLTRKNTPPSPGSSGSDSENEPGSKDSPKHPGTVRTQPNTPDGTPPGSPQFTGGVPESKFPGQPSSASAQTMTAAHARLNGADIAKQRLAEATKQKELAQQGQQNRQSAPVV